MKILDISDKKKAAVVTLEVSSYETDNNKTQGDLAFKRELSVFIKNMGGFGYKGTKKMKIPK